MMTHKLKSVLCAEHTATKRLKIANVAVSCALDPTANRAKIVDTVDVIIQAHPDVELVIFGEMVLGWYNADEMPEYHRQVSQPVSMETLKPYSCLAAQHGVYLCLGIPEIDGSLLYNTQVLFDPQGEIQAVHRKWFPILSDRCEPRHKTERDTWCTSFCSTPIDRGQRDSSETLS